jgi:glycosyltransferase involved in cell wall biosynthesis
MLLTVAVCTWNRSRLLRQCLEQMTRLDIPSGVDWELLVVNNNCTDDTDAVITAFDSRLPIRRLFEPKPGKSFALNRAVCEACGEYILWTDDDGLVNQDWLAAYVQAIQRWPGAAFFGGPVRPWFPATPPRWLMRVWPQVATAYAARDLGAEPFQFDGGNRLPYGVNWAIRLKEQRRYEYSPCLGPQPGSHIRGEELSLMGALLADGCQGWWVPNAGVQHCIPLERMTTRYLRNYFLGQGQYLATIEPTWNGPTLLGKPRWLWRHIVTAELRYRIRRLTSPPEIWIHELIAASMAWGTFKVDKSRENSLRGRGSCGSSKGSHA